MLELSYDTIRPMSWVEKGEPTPFDDRQIDGLFMLDGDEVARVVGKDWTKGEKFPLIAFPSGEEFHIWDTSQPKKLAIVHLAGEMDLPYAGDDRDSAYEHAMHIAEQVGYAVYKEGKDSLEVWVPADQDRLLITYDNEGRKMADIVRRDWNEPVNQEEENEPLFSLGRVVATPGALEALEAAQHDPIELLSRHISGDWGKLDEHDTEQNQLALEQGYRLLSAYVLVSGVKVWVITEADRSTTTLLLPSEY